MTRRFITGLSISLVVFLLGALTPAHAAWPPDETAGPVDYKDPTNWPNDPGYAGLWQYWSFVPDKIVNQVDARTKRLGTGGHYDQAWAKTTGDPNVLIAVTDSGIEWSEPDVLNRFYLNQGELPPPIGCPGSDGIKYDVNGDGRFNVQDYTTATGHMLPAFSMLCDGRVQDFNKNGVVDAQDLIHSFEDGKDDDGNGYVDDISGWDFFHNDNDPTA